MLRKLFFEFQYRFSKPPWDSGITPPEVVSFIENNSMRGRALDLGCGTGTNAIYLARNGFNVIGVDFSPKAITLARAKAQRANLAIDLRVEDVTQLDFLQMSFDFILDIGCLHGIDPARRAQYIEQIARLTKPGSVFMLYTFSPRPPDQRGHLLPIRNVGITPDEVIQMVAANFKLTRVEYGMNRGERASAWFWLERK